MAALTAGSILFFSWIGLISASENHNQSSGECQHHSGIHLASWNYCGVGQYVLIITAITLCGVAKIGFHKAHWLSKRFPESCILIIFGIIGGILLNLIESNHSELFKWINFTPNLFFYLLLPPIVLEASYSLYAHEFFSQISTILTLAIVGTLINFGLIGSLLYFVNEVGALGTIRGFLPNEENVEITGMQIFLFASLISAVDPVAVLAIFQEVHVNNGLYFLVFGESLLNDGVAVVLYKTMETFSDMELQNEVIESNQFLLAITSFFTIALGGLIIGIFVGFVTAFITKYTQDDDVRVVEPLIVYGTAYLAYMLAELFHWSGIISLIGCGLTQKRYAFRNISKDSKTTIERMIKTASSLSDIVIFLFLGVAVVKYSTKPGWHVGFVAWSLSFCLICRFLSVYGLVWIANRRRVKKINLQEQFIMAYGGLRGAVGYSLVELINEELPPRNMFVTTTIVIVMFTIFVQGGTIKWLVNLLKIDKKKNEEKIISEEVNDNVMDHLTAGIDLIAGRKENFFLSKLEYLDENILKPAFCIQNTDIAMLETFEKLALSDHLFNLYGPTLAHQEGKGGILLKPVKSSEYEEDIGDDESDLSRENTPPPLPPRAERNNSYLGSFRKSSSVRRKNSANNAGGQSTLYTLPLPHNEEGYSRRHSKEEYDFDRTALRNSFRKPQKRYDRNNVNDHESTLEKKLKEKHVKAKRISQMVLQQQNGSNLLQNQLKFTQSRSVNSEEADRLVDHLEHPGVGEEDVFLHRVPQSIRPGVQEVLRRQVERVRSFSMTSANSADQDQHPSNSFYFHANEVTSGRSTSTNKDPMENSTPLNKSSNTSAADSDSSKPNMAPVEKRKNAGGNTGRNTGRRKLTPHPLNPNTNTLDSIDAQGNLPNIESKLSILAEDEESKSASSAENIN